MKLTKEEVKADIVEYLDYRSQSGFLNNMRYRFNRETKEIFRLYEILEFYESEDKKSKEIANQIYMCIGLSWKDYKMYNSMSNY